MAYTDIQELWVTKGNTTLNFQPTPVNPKPWNLNPKPRKPVGSPRSESLDRKYGFRIYGGFHRWGYLRTLGISKEILFGLGKSLLGEAAGPAGGTHIVYS